MRRLSTRSSPPIALVETGQVDPGEVALAHAHAVVEREVRHEDDRRRIETARKRCRVLHPVKGDASRERERIGIEQAADQAEVVVRGIQLTSLSCGRRNQSRFTGR
jgi:hypothetical protein